MDIDDEEDDWPAIKEALDEIKAGDPGVSIEEAFELARRSVHKELGRDDWPAIKEALDGIENGTNKGMSLDEAIANIKRRHGL